MRSTDERFYKTKEWRNCRDSYAKMQGHLCEKCLKVGKYSPGVFVHHVIPLDRVNVYNPEIALNFENLELLCARCHAEEHSEKRKGIRYKIDEQTGTVQISEAPLAK